MANLKFKFNDDQVTNEIAKRLYLFNRKTPIQPIRLFVYPSAFCNSGCKYCVDGLNTDVFNQHLMPVSGKEFFAKICYIDKLIKDIKQLKIRDLHLFGGGEPFFHKENMFYFLERLRKVDVFIRMITNAKNLNQSDIERIVGRRLISQLNISLNADSENTAKLIYPDYFRFKHSLEILKWIKKSKKNHGSDFPRVNIMYILLNINYKRITKTIELLGEKDIDYFFIQPLRVCADKQKRFVLSPAQRQEFIDGIPYAVKELNKYSIRSNINEFRESSSEEPAVMSSPASRPLVLTNRHGFPVKCHVPLTTLSICYNGNIPFCQFRYDRLYKQNYFSVKNLKAFIKSKEYVYFTDTFVRGQLSSICARCNFCVSAETDILKKRFVYFADREKRKIPDIYGLPDS